MNLKKQINFLRHYNEDLFNLINSSFNDAKKIINIKDIFLKTKKIIKLLFVEMVEVQLQQVMLLWICQKMLI